MMRVRRMSERPMTKVGQLLDRLKRMFLLTVDQLMIKAREMSNKPVVKPTLMDKKHTIKARELIKLLRDLLNSGVSKLKGKLKTGASKPMTKARKMSDKPNNGVSRLRREQKTGALQLTTKAEKT